MFFLIVASLLWAFSFGLIKYTLAGTNPLVVAWIRLALSFLVFLPFLKSKGDGKLNVRLAMIGAVQYGLMYAAYLQAYEYLKAYEVVLFTVLTPVYVTIMNDAINKKFNRLFFLCAMVASGAGAFVCLAWGDPRRLGLGFLLMQVSNLCFAGGQVAYRKLMGKMPLHEDIRYYAMMYGGAVLLLSLIMPISLGAADLEFTRGQWLVLLYLGLVPSGLAFFLWNFGARRTKAGSLAVMNNAKIPFGVIASLLVFGESADVSRLAVGVLVMVLAVLASERGITAKAQMESEDD